MDVVLSNVTGEPNTNLHTVVLSNVNREHNDSTMLLHAMMSGACVCYGTEHPIGV